MRCTSHYTRMSTPRTISPKWITWSQEGLTSAYLWLSNRFSFKNHIPCRTEKRCTVTPERYLTLLIDKIMPLFNQRCVLFNKLYARLAHYTNLVNDYYWIFMVKTDWSAEILRLHGLHNHPTSLRSTSDCEVIWITSVPFILFNTSRTQRFPYVVRFLQFITICCIQL